MKNNMKTQPANKNTARWRHLRMHDCHSAIAVNLEYTEVGCLVPLLSFPTDKTAMQTVHCHLINTYFPNTSASANSPLNAHENCAEDEDFGLCDISYKKKKKTSLSRC